MSCLLSLIKKSDTRSPIHKRKRERMKNEMKHGEVELFHYFPSIFSIFLRTARAQVLLGLEGILRSVTFLFFLVFSTFFYSFPCFLEFYLSLAFSTILCRSLSLDHYSLTTLFAVDDFLPFVYVIV